MDTLAKLEELAQIHRGCKRCTKCGESKPASTEYFSPNRHIHSGLASWCKSCNAERDRERRAEDPEYVARVAALAKERYYSDKETLARQIKKALNAEKRAELAYVRDSPLNVARRALDTADSVPCEADNGETNCMLLTIGSHKGDHRPGKNRKTRKMRVSQEDGTGVSHSRKFVYLHRLICTLFHGETGEHVHHKCGNNACINPDHLQPVKQVDNLAEMLARRKLTEALEEANARLTEAGLEPVDY